MTPLSSSSFPSTSSWPDNDDDNVSQLLLANLYQYIPPTHPQTLRPCQQHHHSRKLFPQQAESRQCSPRYHLIRFSVASCRFSLHNCQVDEESGVSSRNNNIHHNSDDDNNVTQEAFLECINNGIMDLDASGDSGDSREEELEKSRDDAKYLWGLYADSQQVEFRFIAARSHHQQQNGKESSGGSLSPAATTITHNHLTTNSYRINDKYQIRGSLNLAGEFHVETSLGGMASDDDFPTATKNKRLCITINNNSSITFIPADILNRSGAVGTPEDKNDSHTIPQASMLEWQKYLRAILDPISGFVDISFQETPCTHRRDRRIKFPRDDDGILVPVLLSQDELELHELTCLYNVVESHMPMFLKQHSGAIARGHLDSFEEKI